MGTARTPQSKPAANCGQPLEQSVFSKREAVSAFDYWWAPRFWLLFFASLGWQIQVPSCILLSLSFFSGKRIQELGLQITR
jgi:hypothetical protein